MSQAAAIADRLEDVLERLEAALVAREAENQRLRGVESAAFAALAELDHLLRRADAAAVTDNNRTTTLRAAERG